MPKASWIWILLNIMYSFLIIHLYNTSHPHIQSTKSYNVYECLCISPYQKRIKNLVIQILYFKERKILEISKADFIISFISSTISFFIGLDTIDCCTRLYDHIPRLLLARTKKFWTVFQVSKLRRPGTHLLYY